MVKRKGQDTLVRAWPDVLRELPDARLLLVGDGPNRARIERMVRRRRLQDSVIMTGRVPAEDIPKCMDAGDVFAMPCRSRLFGLEAEAFGIVYLEAAACGLPVSVGMSGGAPEVATALGGKATMQHELSGSLAKWLRAKYCEPGGGVVTQREVENWRIVARVLEALVKPSTSKRVAPSIGATHL
jgi:phosphatidylinositol alpha-1,6-mannosyltransferase